MASPPERKDFATTKQLRTVMGKYFAELARARPRGGRRPGARASGPAELLRSMGFNVYFPENHGAMLGAAAMATDVIPLANAHGFSPDICSYLTSDIGSYLKGETPLQKMGLAGVPQGRRAGVQHQPVPRREGLVPVVRPPVERALHRHPHAALVQRGGRPAGRLRGPADRGPGRAAGAGGRHEVRHRPACARRCELSRQCTLLWKEVLETAAHAPSPITFFDGTIQMGPAVVLRGATGRHRLLPAAAGRAAAARRPGQGGGGRRAVPHLLGRHADLGQAAGPVHAVPEPADVRGGLDLLQQLDLRGPRPGRSVPQHGPGLLQHLHLPQRRLQREATSSGWSRSTASTASCTTTAKTCPNNSNSRYGMPQRLREAAGQAVPGHPRRPERPAAVLGRAGPHQHRGLRRTAGCRREGTPDASTLCGVDIGVSRTVKLVVHRRCSSSRSAAAPSRRARAWITPNRPSGA